MLCILPIPASDDDMTPQQGQLFGGFEADAGTPSSHDCVLAFEADLGDSVSRSIDITLEGPDEQHD